MSETIEHEAERQGGWSLSRSFSPSALLVTGAAFVWIFDIVMTNQFGEDSAMQLDLKLPPLPPPTPFPTPQPHHLHASHHGVVFNSSLEFCRDIDALPENVVAWQHIHSLPEGCPKDKFVIPIGEGGLNNALLRIWQAIHRINVTRTHTVLLPYLRNRPVRFKPNEHLGGSKLVPISDIVDESSFCEILREANICVICSHAPPGRPKEDFKDGIPKYFWHDWVHDKKANETTLTADVVPDLDPKLYWFMRGLAPNKIIAKAVKRILQRINSTSYLAVHMRIEDDWKAYRQAAWYTNASEIVRMVTESKFYSKLERRETDGKLPVFVATGLHNRAKEAWSEVKDVSLVFNKFDEDEADHHRLSWAAYSMIDLEVAKDSEVFVGTAMFSTFSSNVFFFRHEEAICQAAISHSSYDAAVANGVTVTSYGYHNNKYGWGDGLLECRQRCWGNGNEKPK